jgi:hypothetical protein
MPILVIPSNSVHFPHLRRPDPCRPREVRRLHYRASAYNRSLAMSDSRGKKKELSSHPTKESKTGTKKEGEREDSRKLHGTLQCVVYLLDLQELDIEDECAVGRNAGHRTATISKGRGDGQSTLTTNGHAYDADVPSLDHLTLTDLKGKRCALLVCYSLLSVWDVKCVIGCMTYSQRPCRSEACQCSACQPCLRT